MTRVLVVPTGAESTSAPTSGEDAGRWSRALRDAGIEVVLGASGWSAPAVAAAALQEDVAAVLLVGADEQDVAAVRRELDVRGADDVALRATGTATTDEVTAWATSL